MDLSEDTARELLALAGVALAHEDLRDAMAEICRIPTRAIRNGDGATLMSIGASGPGAVAASSEWAQALDELQYVEHEGPCIGARAASCALGPCTPRTAHSSARSATASTATGW